MAKRRFTNEERLVRKRESNKKYEDNNKSKVNKSKRAWKSKTNYKSWHSLKGKEADRRNKLKLYGLTVGDYTNMFNDQNGRCKICGIHEKELSRILMVDHCHETGIVRGLLCSKCNLGLGLFNDNLLIIYNAIKYLNQTNMAIISLNQGDDKKIPIVVLDTPSIDFTTADSIRIVVFIGTDEQDKFSLATILDHGKLTIDDTDKNKLYVFAERAKTVSYGQGSMSATILATFINSEFPDGFETRTWNISNVARILAGRALDENV